MVDATTDVPMACSGPLAFKPCAAQQWSVTPEKMANLPPSAVGRKKNQCLVACCCMRDRSRSPFPVGRGVGGSGAGGVSLCQWRDRRLEFNVDDVLGPGYHVEPW